MIEIYDMGLKDFEEIKNILESDFDDFWSPNILENELLGENRNYFVAKKENVTIGFVGVMLNFPEMEIMNIVIKKSERRKGIGKLLLNKIIEFAKQNNYERIFLEVNENNFPAIKMYENFYFVQKGFRKNYYKNSENAIIMDKELS